MVYNDIIRHEMMLMEQAKAKEKREQEEKLKIARKFVSDVIALAEKK